MTQEKKQLCALFKTQTYNNAKSAVEINNVEEAVAYGLKNKMACFEVCEISTVVLDGKVFSGEPEKRPGTHYLKVDKLLTAADITAFYEEKIKREDPYILSLAEDFYRNPGPFSSETYGNVTSERFKKIIAVCTDFSMRDQFRSKAPDVLYFDDPFDRGECYICIKPDDKIYDKEGRRIWPPAKSAPRTASPKPQF